MSQRKERDRPRRAWGAGAIALGFSSTGDRGSDHMETGAWTSQHTAALTLPHQPPLGGLGSVDAVQLLQHVTKVAVSCLVGLPDRWLLLFSGPLSHGVPHA